MTQSPLEQELLDSLIARWGYVMGSAGLREALGFNSQAALRNALQRGALPVSTFYLKGRRGPHALTHTVAAWLASRAQSSEYPE